MKSPHKREFFGRVGDSSIAYLEMVEGGRCDPRVEASMEVQDIRVGSNAPGDHSLIGSKDYIATVLPQAVGSRATTGTVHRNLTAKDILAITVWVPQGQHLTLTLLQHSCASSFFSCHS